MNEHKRMPQLILLMAISTLLVAGITLTILYQAAVHEQKHRLVEIVQSQARLMEAISGFDAAYKTEFPGGAEAATLKQIITAHRNYEYAGRTTQFDIARCEKDKIAFLFRKGFQNNRSHPISVQLDSKLAEPMRLALAGKSGTVTGLDHRGETVLAAYEPVSSLNLGIVAKIDLTEIRRPFIEAGAAAALFAVLVVIAGTSLIIRITNPLIKYLEKQTRELTKANDELNRKIEEKKRVETALAKSEKKYRNLFENSTLPSTIIENDMTISMVNSEFEKFSGLPRQEIENKMKWTQFIHEEYLPMMMSYHTQRREAGSRVPAEYECKAIVQNGKVKYVLLKVGMIPDTQESIASFLNITERKKNEDKLRKYKTIVDTANDPLSILDTNYAYQVVNKAYCRNNGKKYDEIAGHTVPELHGKKVFERHIRPKLDKCLAGEVVRYQNWFDYPALGRRYMDVTYYPYREGDRSISGAVVSVRDITDIRQAERKLKTSLKEKEILLRELYHRTKNNIQVINSLLTLQSAYLEDDQALACFKDIKTRINSMALVHEKLYQSRNLSRLDLKDYIEDLASGLLRSYQATPERVSLHIIADAIPVVIDTAVPCGLVINELLSNALKYAFPEGQKGDIRINLHLTDNDEIDLSIGDNGIGLPEDIDFRKTNSLGLQLVVGIIESQLKGKIDLNTTDGTEFHIRFKEIYPQRI